MCKNNDLLVKSSADLFQVYDFLFIKEGGKERRGLVTQLINMEGLNTMYKVGLDVAHKYYGDECGHVYMTALLLLDSDRIRGPSNKYL